MKPTAILLVLALLTLAGVAVLVDPAGDPEQARAPSSTETSALRSAVDSAQADLELQDSAEPPRALSFPPRTIVTGYTETPEIVTPEYTLIGQLITLDLGGNPIGPFDGFINLRTSESFDAFFVVTAGTFQVRSRQPLTPDQVTARALSVEGHSFEFRRDARVTDSASNGLVFLAHEMPRIRLHVLDDRTGEELDGITILVGSGVSSDHDRIPSDLIDWREVIADVASPVDLTPLLHSFMGQGVGTLVGAPGFAWSSIFVDPDRDADLTVRLVPEARTTVQLVAGQPSQEGEPVDLWVLGGDGPDPTAVAKFETTVSGRVWLVGLAAGDYRLIVAHHTANGAVQQLADEALSLLPGQNPMVHIQCEPILDAESESVSFALHLSDEWGIKAPYATMRSGGQVLALEAHRLGPSEWLLESSEIARGRYFFSLGVLGLSGLLSVPRGGLDQVPIHVPDPITLDVVFVDDSTGLPVPVSWLFWRLVTPKPPSLESLGGPSGDWSEHPPASSARLEVAPGTLRFDLGDEDKLLVDAEFTIEASTTLELRVQDLQQIVFTFAEDGKRVRVPTVWLLAATLEGPGERRSVAATEVGVAVAVSKPGTYSVSLPAFRDFEAVGPFEVVVPADGEGRLEIEVVHTSAAASEKE